MSVYAVAGEIRMNPVFGACFFPEDVLQNMVLKISPGPIYYPALKSSGINDTALKPNTMDTEGEALADVAYGLFEVFLNKELHKQGHSLFEHVETNTEFSADFTDIFASFSADYPYLADALTDEYGSVDAIYRLFSEGEGIIPTKTTKIFWILLDAPGYNPGCADAEKAGKWLMFLEPAHTDELWKKIRDATAAGELGISTKVSTAKQSPESRDERMVIYVYTRDWEDEDDVMRIREVLRNLGVTDRIGYKRNIETFQGEYSEKGKKVTYYTA